jgi:predicted transposase YbfD/YdcC
MNVESSFAVHFSIIRDPRREHGRIYELKQILFMAVFAAISNCDDWVEVEECCKAHAELLRHEFGIEQVPSHDTFRAVFARIDPDAFAQCFLNWMREIAAAKQWGVLAIDGKRLRGSHDRGAGRAALETVTAWLAEHSLVLAIKHVQADTNEIATVPQLLRELVLKNCVVTMDAANCQAENTRLIVERGGEYVLALKENQEKLHSAVKLAFDHESARGFKNTAHARYVTREKSRDRIEERQYTLLTERDYIEHFNADGRWWQLKSVLHVRRTRTMGGIVGKTEDHYYICSLSEDVERVAGAVRAHWSIENGQHYTLDVALHEDGARNRVGFQPENMAVVRRMALNLIKLEPTPKISLNHKRKRAARDANFAIQVLKGAPALN